MKCIRVSSSIANFREKLYQKYSSYERWSLFTLFSPTLFFGAYHWLDWLRILAHRGRRVIFWCGSDILAIDSNPFWRGLLSNMTAEHVCENLGEQRLLRDLGISARIHPMFFDDISGFTPSFKPSKTPHVFLTSHPRAGAYGVGIVESIAQQVPEITFHIYGVEGQSHENIVYHGLVSNTQFNNEIRNYQAALRLNDFDGFSETLGKSILLGQYPISKIFYPFIDGFKTNSQLIHLLKGLKTKTKPNIVGYNYWKKILSKPCEL